MVTPRRDSSAAGDGRPAGDGLGLDRLPWWAWAVLTVFLVVSGVLNIAQGRWTSALWGLALLWAASGAFNAARRRRRGEPSSQTDADGNNRRR